MIISSEKLGASFISGASNDLTYEAAILFGTMLKKTPEILLAVIATYSDEIEKLNPNDYGKRLEFLYDVAKIAKKRFNEGELYDESEDKK